MARAIVLLLDSLGIGASQDAADYGDAAADTFGHLLEHFPHQLSLPNLSKRGLSYAALASTGKRLTKAEYPQQVAAQWGYAVEVSRGKDTPSGHWEMMGVPVLFDFGYFPETTPCFPDTLIEQLVQQAQLPGVLGLCHASGTVILDKLGEQHVKTGQPIVYTSADSVLQIAAHEQHFGLQRLWDVCLIARQLVDDYRIGRVIARPFIGEPGKWQRTANRRDYTMPPPAATLFEHLLTAGGEVIAIGKTADIFAHRGISQQILGDDNDDLFSKTLAAVQSAGDQSLIFTNFVDFDSKYGHRRDVVGYGQALQAFDARLPELDACLQPDDVVLISADHGCDPTFAGSDHTREHVPCLFYGPKIQPGFIGRRESFADMGQTLAQHLNLPPLDHGIAFFS